MLRRYLKVKPNGAKSLKNAKNLSTQIWMLLIFVFVIYFLIKDPTYLRRIFANLDLLAASSVILLIVLGKIFIILLVHHTLKGFGEHRSVLFAWRAYSLADLAKYLPGGIWSIAGRLAIYKKDNIDLKKGGKIILTETYILLLSFSLTGAAALSLALKVDNFFLLILFLSFVCGLASLKLCIPKGSWYNKIITFFATSLGCLLFGISFAILALPVTSKILWSVGQFNLAFVAGQLALFAPSGIGVREVIVGLTLPYGSEFLLRDVIEVAIVHRFLWLIADFIVFTPLVFFSKE